MKTYLALSQIAYYLEDTDKTFKALFGILFLTNDINYGQQFDASQYLSEAVGIEELPQYSDLLIMLEKVGSSSLKINILPAAAPIIPHSLIRICMSSKDPAPPKNVIGIFISF